MNDKIISQLKKHGKACVIMHISPDGDTLGSAIALCLALRSLGISCDAICDDNVPGKYSFVPHISEVKKSEDGIRYDTAVAVDCADMHLLGDAAKVFRAAKNRICIDHHASNPHYAEKELFNAAASSTGEIMLGVIKKLGASITREIAECLYTAIASDTGNFSYSNTTRETFLAAAELTSYGIDLPEIASCLFKARSYSFSMMLARALNGMRMFSGKKIAILYLSSGDVEELQNDFTEYEGIVEFAREIQGVEVAVFIREIGRGLYKISLRSKPCVDIRGLAEGYGGGGHRNAAGCQIKGGLEQIINKLAAQIEPLLVS